MSSMWSNYAASAMSFAGTMEQGRAESNNFKYQKKVAENNAEAIKQQGEAAVEAQTRAFRRTIGSMTAAYGGTGVDTSMGSPLDVLGDAIRQGTLDQLSTKYNYTVAANSQLDQAALYKLGARNAEHAAWFNAWGNALSSMSSGSVNSGGYGGGSIPASNYGGNSLTPGATYTGTQSLSTGWPGDGGASSFNGVTGSGEYSGIGSTSTTWAGFGEGWG